MAIDTEPNFDTHGEGYMLVRECDGPPGKRRSGFGYLACSFIPAEYVVHVEQRKFSSRVTFTDGEVSDVIIARKVDGEDDARQFVERMGKMLSEHFGLRSITVIPDDGKPFKP